MEKLKKLPDSAKRLPLRKDSLAGSLSSGQTVSKSEEKDLEQITLRLSELAKTPRRRRRRTKNAKDDSTIEIIKPDKTNSVLSSELQTGLDESSLSYVESKPEQNFASLSDKTSRMILSEEKLRELAGAAPGAALAEIKPKMGKKKLKKARKLERESTKGEDWFGMRAPELTEESRRDLEVLQMRNALDPKRFYKKNDHGGELPKYFQVSTLHDFFADPSSAREAQGRWSLTRHALVCIEST